MRIPSFVIGFLILAGLEVITESAASAERASMLPLSIAAAVKRIVSPELALIPNLHDGPKGSKTAAATLAGAHKGADAAAGVTAFAESIPTIPTKAGR